jgi:hypothetical protein
MSSLRGQRWHVQSRGRQRRGPTFAPIEKEKELECPSALGDHAPAPYGIGLVRASRNFNTLIVLSTSASFTLDILISWSQEELSARLPGRLTRCLSLHACPTL